MNDKQNDDRETHPEQDPPRPHDMYDDGYGGSGCILTMLIPIGVMLVILLLAIPANACTSSLGVVCPKEIPKTYAIDCEDGCFLVQRLTMNKYKWAMHNVEKKEVEAAKSLRLANVFKASADFEMGRADLATEAMEIFRYDLGEARKELIARPTWTHVFAYGLGAAVLGAGAYAFYDWQKGDEP